MQVYLQYKYYITVTKTVDGTPYRDHGYVSLRFGGMLLWEWEHNNTATKTGM